MIVSMLFILSSYIALYLVYEETLLLKPEPDGFASTPTTPLEKFADRYQYRFFQPARRVSCAIEWSRMSAEERAADMVSRSYLVDPQALGKHRPLKAYFIAEGIDFPPGASVIYGVTSRQLIFKNTRANHAKLEELAAREFALE